MCVNSSIKIIVPLNLMNLVLLSRVTEPDYLQSYATVVVHFTQSSCLYLKLMSSFVWQQHLGHPENKVFESLISSYSIQCTKTQLNELCHVCQFGKQTKHPFSTYDFVVKHEFDNIHSNIWTSCISSVGGFHYYVMFLDHYTHYLRVYPLKNKSDVFFSKYNKFNKTI